MASRPRRRFGEKKVEGGPLPSEFDEDHVFNQLTQETQEEVTSTPPDAPLEIHTPPHQSVTFPPLLQQQHLINSPPGHPVSATTGPASAQGGGDGDSDTDVGGGLEVDPSLHMHTTPDSKRPPLRTTSSSSFRKRQFGSGRRGQDNNPHEEDEPDALSILDKVAQLETSMSCSDADSPPNNATPTKQQSQRGRNNNNTIHMDVENNNPMDDDADGDGDVEELPVQILRKGGSPGSLKSLRRGPQVATTSDTTNHQQKQQYSPQKPASPVAKNPDTSSVDVPIEIRCPVCLDSFNEPVTLLCNHNVCKEHILDLACQEDSFTKPSEEFEVKCPKCRVTTHFPQGIASVKVNHEMNALVSMMMNLLAAQQQQQQVVPAAVSAPQPPLVPRGDGGQASAPPARSRSGGRKAVTFNHEETRVVMLGGSKDGLVFDSDGTLLSEGRPINISSLPALESALKRAGNVNTEDASSAMNKDDGTTQQPSTDAHKTPVEDKKFQKAQKQLEGLERQLELQRERLKAEREEAARQKVLDYKKARQEEIDKRREELMRELQKDDDDLETDKPRQGASPRPSSRGERSPALDDRVWGAAENALQKLKEERLKKREAEREAREKAIRDGVQEWANRGAQPVVSMEGSVLEKHLRAMADFESGGAQLNMSQKAREAEERIMHMYKTPTASEKQRRDKPPTPEPAPLRDIEVEHALWQAEQRVLQEEEAELTRAQMAEIAEQRARVLISNFASRSGTAPKTPLKPSYVPKLNRLQKF